MVEFALLGFTNEEDYESDKSEIEKIIHQYDGLIIRSRLPIDRDLLKKAKNLNLM